MDYTERWTVNDKTLGLIVGRLIIQHNLKALSAFQEKTFDYQLIFWTSCILWPREMGGGPRIHDSPFPHLAHGKVNVTIKFGQLDEDSEPLMMFVLPMDSQWKFRG